MRKRRSSKKQRLKVRARLAGRLAVGVLAQAVEVRAVMKTKTRKVLMMRKLMTSSIILPSIGKQPLLHLKQSAREKLKRLEKCMSHLNHLRPL